MNRITKSEFLSVAKAAGWTGSETDYEAMRAFVLASKYARLVKDPAGNSIDVKAVEIVDDAPPAPIVAKTVAVDTTTVNPTNDTQTLIDAAVSKAIKAYAPGASINPNRAIADNTVTVTPMEEMLFKAQNRHIKSGYAQAKKFQTYLYANVLGNTPQMMNHPQVLAARKRLAEDPVYKAYGSSTQAGGGALTFMEFVPDLIANVNQFGAARKLAKVFPMTEESSFYPVRQGIHTLSYAQQNTAITPSTGVTYSNVQLTAKTGTCIVQLSKQLVWDANISVVDDMFGEIARCIAYTEDLEFFTGAAEAAYANVRGLANRFAGGGYTGAGTWTAITNAAGYTAGGGTATDHTMVHVSAFLAKVPSYARPGMVITCSPEMAEIVFGRLTNAQGGVTFQETEQYGWVQKFRNIPIIENNVMPTTIDASGARIDIYAGNFQKAALLGDRLGVELDANDSVYWTSNGVGLKGTIRHDIAVHDVGDALASSSGTGRVGPVVCLAQT